MSVLFVILFTFVYGSTAGYVVHRILHIDFFARLAEAHSTHHSLYPEHDYVSETYRDAGENRSTLVFVPIIFGAIVLACIPLYLLFQVWWIYPPIFITGITVGWLNDYLHECFHIIDHPYNKYAYFRKLKYLHLVHHAEPDYNHGIIWFGADKIAGTFKERLDSES
jgi:sterol desaturase/sphingolipid hydroxylase (fatty acid hydroxylase superfamily)